MLYPIGIQNFESLRRDGFFYIDKTSLIYRLVTSGRYYFLSRPRRFGKSLLVSTLEAYFRGKREAFAGLAIDRLEKEWEEHPVLHLDLNARKYEDAGSLQKELNKHLERWEETYHSPYAGRSPEERFYQVIRLAYEHTGRRVVVLVDEYDKPLLQAVGNKALQEEYRSTLKSFYSVLKSMDGCIRFALLTGVTKFGKVSVFSDLNNLEDISMQREYVGICGITEAEIRTCLDDELHALARAKDISYETACNRLKELYDGYHFAPDTEGIYNPFSVFNTLKKKEFGSYWFETGTPTYLVELLKQNRYNLEDMTHVETTANVLNNVYGDDKPLPVIYQSGYLTIKGYDPEFGLYALGFPNKEVEEGFMEFLLPWYASVDAG